MRQGCGISSKSLSVAALGLLAFAGLSFGLGWAQPAYAADDPEKDIVDRQAAVDGQANNLRNLFEIAGRNGLVDLKSDENPGLDSPVSMSEPPTTPPAQTKVADCVMLAPLFDGGQGDFATGLFTELATDWPETAELAATLSTLIDPGYKGEALPIDLSQAGECGASFLPWQALAAPGKSLTAQEETVLTSALADMEPPLQRQLGIQIATRAGLAGNLRLTRRVSDTLIDADLHGQSHHDRDPEHVLLDAILKSARDPVGARTRLSWIAERDGPEQLVAIDLMRTLQAVPAARSELKRLTHSPDELVRADAEERLLATAIDDADIGLVMELVTTTNNLANDEESRARLAQRLEEALDQDDPMKAIQALDVIERLELKGVEFSPELQAKAAVRIAALTTVEPSSTSEIVSSDLPKTMAPEDLSGPRVSDYITTLSEDISTYQEVLSRG